MSVLLYIFGQKHLKTGLKIGKIAKNTVHAQNIYKKHKMHCHMKFYFKSKGNLSVK